ACTQEGADSAESVSECVEYRDECLKEQAMTDSSTDKDCSGYKPALCTVTVAKLKACATAIAKAYDDASRNASCDRYEAAQVNDEPAACKGVPDACLGYDVSGVAVTAP
ncbi:MAG: hypothetical protein JWN04_3470, partial [Myxococcaceae bacterium]|nr:hypothetical protein [Myxococcaceae bacterium]